MRGAINLSTTPPLKGRASTELENVKELCLCSAVAPMHEVPAVFVGAKTSLVLIKVIE